MNKNTDLENQILWIFSFLKVLKIYYFFSLRTYLHELRILYYLMMLLFAQHMSSCEEKICTAQKPRNQHVKCCSNSVPWAPKWEALIASYPLLISKQTVCFPSI